MLWSLLHNLLLMILFLPLLRTASTLRRKMLMTWMLYLLMDVTSFDVFRESFFHVHSGQQTNTVTSHLASFKITYIQLLLVLDFVLFYCSVAFLPTHSTTTLEIDVVFRRIAIVIIMVTVIKTTADRQPFSKTLFLFEYRC
jgi:hypothetical protein